MSLIMFAFRLISIMMKNELKTKCKWIFFSYYISHHFCSIYVCEMLLNRFSENGDKVIIIMFSLYFVGVECGTLKKVDEVRWEEVDSGCV